MATLYVIVDAVVYTVSRVHNIQNTQFPESTEYSIEYIDYNMGTSSAGDHTNTELQGKLQELQNRKKELEIKLATKNEELYKLCVQEVRLTGILPPETPAPSPTPMSTSTPNTSNNNSNSNHAAPQATSQIPAPAAGNSVTVGRARRPPSGQQTRHHTVTSEHISRMYAARLMHNPAAATATGTAVGSLHGVGSVSVAGVASGMTGGRNLSQLSQSHPSLSLSMGTITPNTPSGAVPLLYQYAAQLKARAQQEQAAVMAAACAPRRPEMRNRCGSSGASISLQRMRPVTVDNVQVQECASIASNAIPLASYRPPPEQRVKKKEWYESSLDSPSEVSSGLDLSGTGLSREMQMPKLDSPEERPIRRTASASRPRAPPPRRSPDLSPLSPLSPLEVPPRAAIPSSMSSPPVRSPLSPSSAAPPSPVRPDVPLESPKNCTVVESGKWIPYREVTKPFEMSDFYKYSTKFRQSAQIPSTTVIDNNNFPNENNNEPPPRPAAPVAYSSSYAYPVDRRTQNCAVPNVRRRVRH